MSIARSVFSGGPSDKIANVDIYGDVDPTIRNEYRSNFTAFSSGLLDGLGGTGRITQAVGGGIRDVLDTQTVGISGALSDLKMGNIDQAGAVQRVRSALTTSRNSVGSVKDQLTRSVVSGLTGTPLGQVGDAVRNNSLDISVGGVLRSITGHNPETAKGIAGILSDVVGSELFEVIDVGVESSILKGAIETIVAWGVPELVDDVLNTIENERLRRQVISNSSRLLAFTADIDSVEAMIRSAGASALTAKNPDFARMLLMRYQIPRGETPSNYPIRLTQLVWVLDQIQPNWFTVSRGNDEVWNLAVIRDASPDALVLFSTDVTYRTPALIASNYPRRHVRDLMRSMYPLIALRP